MLLILLMFRPPTYLYTQCLLSVISASSFHMPPAVSIVLHFCSFTPYTTALPLRLYHAHTSFALQHTYTISTLQHAYTISTLQLADTLFSTPSLAGALFNRSLHEAPGGLELRMIGCTLWSPQTLLEQRSPPRGIPGVPNYMSGSA